MADVYLTSTERTLERKLANLLPCGKKISFLDGHILTSDGIVPFLSITQRGKNQLYSATITARSCQTTQHILYTVDAA